MKNNSFPRSFQKFDVSLIHIAKKIEIDFARIAIFLVYFWFGFLKTTDISPAGPLVEGLFQKTLGLMSFGVFYAAFAVFEMTIGILFLIKGIL